MKLIEIIPTANEYVTIVDWLDAGYSGHGKPIARFWDPAMAQQFVVLWNKAAITNECTHQWMGGFIRSCSKCGVSMKEIKDND